MKSSTFLLSEYWETWETSGIEVQELKEISMKHSSKIGSTKKSPPLPPPVTDFPKTLVKIREWLGDCQRCRLCETRNSIVFGTGNEKAKLLFVGEGPGADEDAQGLPFVGRAGKLLDKIIEAMGYQRSDVYIANVVKCRPPQNRTPLPDESEQCMPFLQAQINAIAPQIIVALGLPAATNLTGKMQNMSALRGKFHSLHWNPSVFVMPTYHPAYLLRNPPAKRFVWNDMKLVRAKLESLH